MVGDLIKKDLPKYKLESMVFLSKYLNKQLKKYGYFNDWSEQDWLTANYSYSGNKLWILNKNHKLEISIINGFPVLNCITCLDGRVRNDYGVFDDFDTRKLDKYIYNLIKSTPLASSSENLLNMEFSPSRGYLRINGRLGTRIIYGGDS